jgi:hypothetical protein
MGGPELKRVNLYTMFYDYIRENCDLTPVSRVTYNGL